MAEVFSWLQQWYASHCDGSWEHEHGIDIESLDNPGWRVIISTIGTELEGRDFEPVRRRGSGDDWVDCRVTDSPKSGQRSFVAGCGPRNLTEALEVFRAWAEG